MEFWRRQKDPPGGRDDMEISTLRMEKRQSSEILRLFLFMCRVF